MEYVFGPVNSRRLGKSLGIDTIPLKTCNWNCVYCQLGRTRRLTVERRDYFPRHEILAEVERALRTHPPGEIDWVTFVGSGEPTLHSGIGWLIREVKQITPLPVAVITNGALLYSPLVRQELLAADAVLPSLDAGEALLYRRINRPHPTLKFESIVEGLHAFRREYAGLLWIEVMLVSGMNDTPQALQQIAGVLEKIYPDQVHLNQPVRPPAEAWVQPPEAQDLLNAADILGNVARVVPPAGKPFDLLEGGDLAASILSIISRHPVCESELAGSFQGRKLEMVIEALDALRESGQAQVVERYGRRYWSAASAAYAG